MRRYSPFLEVVTLADVLGEATRPGTDHAHPGIVIMAIWLL
jgi:hypothetical protein